MENRNYFVKNGEYYQVFKSINENKLTILGKGTLRVSLDYLHHIKQLIDNNRLWLIKYDSEDGQNITKIRELQKNNAIDLANGTLLGIINDYPKEKTLEIYDELQNEFSQNFPELQ